MHDAQTGGLLGTCVHVGSSLKRAVLIVIKHVVVKKTFCLDRGSKQQCLTTCAQICIVTEIQVIVC